jgi:diguanylate cyclase (GGDEF)-like protein/PAS domain S-box-containing protein
MTSEATTIRLRRGRPWSRRLLERLITAAAFGVLVAAGVVRLQALLALMAVIPVTTLLERLRRVRSRPESVFWANERVATRTLAATTVIYATGWGPALVIGYVFVIAEELAVASSAAWRSAIGWAVASVVLAQGAVAAGVAPSSIPAPQVHALALLSLLGLVFATRLFARKIEETERAQQAVIRSEERLRALVHNSAEVILVVDPDATVTYVSPSIERALGYSVDEFVGTNGFGHVHPDDAQLAERRWQQALDQPGCSVTMEVRSHHRDGSWRWEEVSVTNLLDDPSVEGLVVNFRDVTERRLSADRLAHDANHDSLTGLANRAAFGARLRTAMAMPERRGRCQALMFVDLDDFKDVNDRFGHAAGDALLRVVATRLDAAVRPGDLVARLGGDEFAVLLDHVSDPADAMEVAERVVAALAAPANVAANVVHVGASVGVAFRRAGSDPVGLMREADVAMYAAKARGKCRVERYDAAIHDVAAQS